MKRMLIVLVLLMGCAQPIETPMPREMEVPVIAEVPEPQVIEPPVPEPVEQPVVEAPVVETKVEEPQPTTHKINIEDYKFSEPTITIKSGDSVEWTQKGQYPHTVTSTESPESFESSIMRKQGETFSSTFTRRGTYRYKCDIHPVMRGVVIVE